MRRKLPSGHLVDDNRNQYEFEFNYEDQTRRCFTLADDAATAKKFVAAALKELEWKVRHLRRAA